MHQSVPTGQRLNRHHAVIVIDGIPADYSSAGVVNVDGRSEAA